MSNLQRNEPLLPLDQTGEGGLAAALTCWCGAPLDQHRGRGRKRLFCCPAHKQREYRNRLEEKRNKTNILYQENALSVLQTLDANSVDCLVTDPPYGYSFMGRDWDKAVPSVDIWKECLRVLKPGAFAFIMSAPRQDVLSQMIIRLSEAGFYTGFTSLYWAYASGFPKAANIGKLVDKRPNRLEAYRRLSEELEKERKNRGLSKNDVDTLLGTNTAYSWWVGRNHYGVFKVQLPSQENWKKLKELFSLPDDMNKLFEEAEREIIGKKETGNPTNWYANQDIKPRGDGIVNITVPATPQAKALDGSYGGFQPKPAVEVILVCMKPLSEKTFVDQALNNGKGITWLDDCRIPYDGEIPNMGGRLNAKMGGDQPYGFKVEGRPQEPNYQGRCPANLIVSNDALHRDDSGSFSRYFDLDKWFERKLDELPASVRETFPYLIVPKASKSEKNKGLENSSNAHPTVKPIKLMSYLIILGSRQGDIILDPFIGSGTTCVAASMLGRRYIGIELHAEYVHIAQQRLKNAS